MSDAIERAVTLGTTYFKNERFLEAKDLFLRTLRLIQAVSTEDVANIRRDLGLIEVPGCESVHPRLVKVLDNIAACYEKLGNLEKALAVTERMVRKEPYNLKCYMRRGKILQKLHRDTQAYDNYKIGLHKCKMAYHQYHVRTSQRFIDTVSSQKDQVKQRVVSASRSKALNGNPQEENSKRHFIDPIEEHRREINSHKGTNKRLKKNQNEQDDDDGLIINKVKYIDFLALLPLEIIVLILNHLSTKDLINLLQVSKLYQSKIMLYPDLFQDFNLNSSTTRSLNQFNDFLRKLYPLRKFYKGTTSPRTLKSVQFSSKLASEENKLVQKLFTFLQNYRCNRVILSIPYCTTYHLSKYMLPNDNFCKNIKELSLTTSLRSDRDFEINVINRFSHLEKFELIIDSAVVPINEQSSSNKLSTEDLRDKWCMELQHLKILCDSQKIKSFPLTKLFTSVQKREMLTKLYITGTTLKQDSIVNFTFLVNFPKLKVLWLENNKNCKFNNFLKIIKMNNVFQGNLEKLVFRENSMSSRIDLEDFDNEYHYSDNLQNLNELDVMGTSISGLGLTRLTSYLSSGKLKKLNIGDCPYIQLQKLPNESNTNVLSTLHFFNQFDNIEELILAQMGSLNDISIPFLTQQCDNLANLNKLDLSLNPSISGVSIYQLIVRLYETRGNKPLPHLIINGCNSISHITVNALKAKRLVKRLDCMYEQETWRQFGLNSYKYR